MRRALSSLPVRFALVSAVLVALVAVVLQLALEGMIERRALDDAERSAAFVTDLVVAPLLAADDPSDGLSDESRQRLDHAVTAGLEARTLRRIKLFDEQGTVIFSDDRQQVGRRATGPTLEGALDGQVLSEVADTTRTDHAGERGLGRLLEVFVPVYAADGQITGVAELYVPYGAVEAGIAQDERQLLLLLAGGLGLLWVALHRLVAHASRQLRAQMARNEHQALHDALTGLPNRTLLFDRAERALAQGRREQRSTAMLLLDLDRFKEVNDTLGHHNGDRLLCEVAFRLQAQLRDADSMARLGGDEFAVLLPATDEIGARLVADRLAASLHEPVGLDGLAIAVGVSIGIAVAPKHGTDAEQLLQRADVAMYVAKQGAGHVSTYCEADDTYSPDRLELLAELRGAIAGDQMRLHFQPKSDVSTGALVGFEALCRWQHPTRGLVAPDDFIPLAEHSGLISELTPWVLEHALRVARSWGDPALSVAVNVSVRNLVDTTFPEVVARLIAETGVAPDTVVLEITESSLMTDPATSLEVLRRLKALGVRLAVDDYGSGYSSLAYLQQLPVDELKIDRSFVRDIAMRERDRAIVRSTVELGRSLGLIVVAEGVEDGDAWTALDGVDCDQLQGYFLARPLPEGEVADWIAEYVRRPARISVRALASSPG